jgi:hypothetical protein
VGGIEKFVESFFDFLSRKTDFYYESFPGDKMGFPPGYNKQLVMQPICRFSRLWINFRRSIIKRFRKEVQSSLIKKFKKPRSK